MTREEAITRIKDHIEIHRYHERNAVKIFEALDMAIKALEQPEPCNLPQFDATCDGDILVKGVKMPKGCVYEGEDGKTEYCFLCNHADVPFCMYLEWEPEAAIGIDERPCYCPLEPQEPCEDAVSREAVTDVIRHSDIFSTWYEMDDTDDIVAEVIDEARKQLVDDVNELPSVTPKCPECDDVVSRRAAIDVAENAFVRGLLASPDIRKLPSVQPVPCEDAVSRDSVKFLLCKETCHPGAFCPDGFCKEICEKVDALPSATPKQRMGEWIPVSERLPENDDAVLISHKHGVGKAWWNGRFWSSATKKCYKTVIAWMPLPEPYRAERRTDGTD